MAEMINTDQDAREYIGAAITAGGGATGDEYDLDAIARDLRDLMSGYPYDAKGIGTEVFWDTVIRHERVYGF